MKNNTKGLFLSLMLSVSYASQPFVVGEVFTETW
jgi:hypothetical protein